MTFKQARLRSGLTQIEIARKLRVTQGSIVNWEDLKKYVDEKTVSEVTGLAVQRLRNRRFQNQGPPYCKIGRAVRYRLDEVYSWMENQKVKHLTAISFGIMLFFAWLARICQLATITGTYMAGLLIGLTTLKQKVLSEINTIGQSIFIPLFFITIGLEAQLSSVTGHVSFGVLFIALAILAKIIGCGTGAWGGGRHSLKECMRIGIGMIPRAEVALAIASVGLAHSIITKTDFSLTVLLCLTTALITPILLRLSFAGEAGGA